MGVTWTEEQQKVISLRDRNILVSAAAGSGKTAVLVQRILSKIMDTERPVDIDRLLIMTFTRAAAGEMKERISAAIDQILYDNPDNEHLQRQASLIHNAQITTIDGFCAYIIRNYFHMIDLDPGYRTAEEGELKLLREDVMKEVLEAAYARKGEKFLSLVECYATGKTDDEIRDMHAVIPPLHRLRHDLDADVVVDRRRRNELLILELRREIVQIFAQQHRDLLHIQSQIGDLLPARKPEIVQILFPAAQLARNERVIVCHFHHLADRIIPHPADFTRSNCVFSH